MNHSLTESFGAAGARYADGNSEGVDGSVTSLMSATSNTNSNANTDVVGIDLSGAVTTRLAGRDVLFNRSPLSSGQSTTSSSSSSTTSRECTPEPLAGPAEMDPSLHHLPHTSPIAGDLPTSEVLPNVTSPSLGFELPPHENEGSSLPHSPDTPTSAQYNMRPEMQSLPLSSNIASPTNLSSSPPGLNIMLDPHGPLSNVIFSQLTPVTNAAGQLQDDDELQVCLWNDCGHEFSSLRSLVSHLDRGHTLAMSQYVCQWKDCSRGQKPFDARYKLITHLRCHTGEKPYKCEISGCSRCFSRLENLKLHIRTHTGEKPYVCHFEGCNKRFNNTSDRAKHMKTHITRKPYACKFPGCGKSYTDPSSMRKHVKFAHKMRESGEPVVGCNMSSQRSSRKYSTSSSSSSSPSTPTSILLPKVHGGAITVSPVGGTFFPASPRVAQAMYVQSPQSLPSANHTLVVSSANTSRSSPSLISVPTVFQVAGQTFNTPLNIFQPGVAAAQQVPQPILMQSASGSQQPVLMMLPNATSVAANGQQIGQQSPQKVAHVLQGVPQIVVSQQSHDQPQHAATLLAAQQSSPQPQARVQVQLNGKDSDSSTIEKQLRLQIAHLQQQLMQSSRPTGTAACSSQQTKSLQQNERVFAVQSQVNQLPANTATSGGNSVVAIVTAAATKTTQPQQGGFFSLIQPHGQAVTHAQLPTAIQPQQLSNVIPTQIMPCVQPSTAFQLSNLTTPVAQNLTNNPLDFSAKNVTFVNPAATTVWGLTPGRSGAYLIPQVMLPGAQVLQSQGATPQIIQLAPQHQGNGKI